jgi:hypothetical protein
LKRFTKSMFSDFTFSTTSSALTVLSPSTTIPLDLARALACSKNGFDPEKREGIGLRGSISGFARVSARAFGDEGDCSSA